LSDKVAVAGYSWDHHHGVIICRHVYEGAPVRLFCFDSDRDLQFMCGADNHIDQTAYEVAGLIHLLERHPEVGTLPDMSPGEWAERFDENSDWVVGILDANDDEEGVIP
jgi:hypothetical protein